MEWSWTIFAIVFGINLVWIELMLLAQRLDKSLPPRHSIIPGTRQKFLYMQDFNTMTWGDFIGVALINCAFVHVVMNYAFGFWVGFAFVGIAFALGLWFAHMCISENHKPDMGFPDIGKISMLGLLHLPYFGIGVTAGAFCVWFIFAGYLRGSVLYVGLAGGLVYALAFLSDIMFGNFDPLKPISKSDDLGITVTLER